MLSTNGNVVSVTGSQEAGVRYGLERVYPFTPGMKPGSGIYSCIFETINTTASNGTLSVA